MSALLKVFNPGEHVSPSDYIKRNESKIVCLFFSADYCSFCKKTKTLLNSFIYYISNLNIDILQINLDEFDNSKYKIEFNINVIPTLLLFDNKKLVKKKVGSFISVEDLNLFFKIR